MNRRKHSYGWRNYLFREETILVHNMIKHYKNLSNYQCGFINENKFLVNQIGLNMF